MRNPITAMAELSARHWWEDFGHLWAFVGSAVMLKQMLVIVATNENDEREIAADAFVKSMLLAIRTAVTK